jgi:hypothetical protein
MIGWLWKEVVVVYFEAFYRDSFNFCYVDDVRTSQETHLWASMASYKDKLAFCYVYDVRTSDEIYLWASVACYMDSFTFYM